MGLCALTGAIKSSRGVPRGSPLSHHRAYSSYSAVSSRLQRGVMGLEADEPKLRKPLQRHGFVGGRTACPTPPSLAREGQRPCPACRHPALHEEVRDCLDTFALLEAHAAESATKPVVDIPAGA